MALTGIRPTRPRGFGTDRNSNSSTISDGGVTSEDSFWLELDVVETETHTHTTRVTTNPVQNGAEVANNAINDPIRLSLTGGVSDTPLFFQTGNWGGTVSSVTGIFSGDSDEVGTRSQQAFQSLVELKNSQVPITIDTGLVTYNNMLLTVISTTTTNLTEFAPMFNMEFTEILSATVASDDSNKGNQSLINPSETNLTGILSSVGGIIAGKVLAS